MSAVRSTRPAMIHDTSHEYEYPGAPGVPESDHDAAEASGKYLHYFPNQWKHRHVAFWNVRTGELLSDYGNGTTLKPRASITSVLELLERFPVSARPRVLYLVGGARAATVPARDWWTTPGRDGWSVEDYEVKAHAATYTRGTGKAKEVLDVRMSAGWFGDEYDDADARLVRDAYMNLRALLVKHFDPHATLLVTPAQTGNDLLQRSLPRGKKPGANRNGHTPGDYPPAPAALRDMLWHNAGQGRMQFCPLPELAGTHIDGLYPLDARWQYAACVSNLPVGIPDHDYYPDGADAAEAFGGMRPGWYRVIARVPDHWRHIGLIADPAIEDVNARWQDQPGAWIGEASGGVWVGAAQLGLAIEYGWQILILERWLYRDSERMPGADPAGLWRRRLVELRAECGDSQQYGTAGELMAAAARKLLIDPIGLWHARSKAKLQITPAHLEHTIHGNIPGMSWIDHKGKLIYWYREIPYTADQLARQHPEWSAKVWDTARYYTAREALAYPRRYLAAIRSDALILTRQLPLCRPDTNRPGAWRYKGIVPGPFAMPATADAMQALRGKGGIGA